MKKFQALTLLLSTLFLSGYAKSAVYWETCNSCTVSEMEWVAKRAVPTRTNGQFSVYVMDITSEIIKKFQVTAVFEPETFLSFTAARLKTVESHIQSDYDAAIVDLDDFLKNNADIEIPSDVLDSAFGLVHSTYNQNQVNAYVANNLNNWQIWGAITSIPLAALGKLVDVNSVLELSYSDGSTSTVRLSGVKGDFSTQVEFEFEYKQGSAKDADGNQIPSNEAEARTETTSSTMDRAAALADFIELWYSGSVVCTSRIERNLIITTCVAPK